MIGKSNICINGEDYELDLSTMTAKQLKEWWPAPADYLVVILLASKERRLLEDDEQIPADTEQIALIPQRDCAG